jgi:hypothetical protein
MRPARLVSGLALLVLGGAVARAEPPPYEAAIAVPEVEVRSGPSQQYYATSKLRQGDRVTVVREDHGWLAIKPPPGSFSWVNTLFLDDEPGLTRMVRGTDVEVRVGSALSDDPPTVKSPVKLPRGTQVFLMDQNKAYDNDTVWLPILPPEQEVRYLPAEAIKSTPQVQQTVRSSPATPGSASPPPATPPVSNNPAEDALWQQAQRAETTNPQEAKRLYLQLANQTADHHLRLACWNRMHFLDTGNRGSVPHGYQPGHPSQASYPNAMTTSRISPTPTLQAPAPYYPPPVRPTGSQYTYYRETPPPPVANPAPAYNYAQRPGLPAAQVQWSQPGWLRRTSIWLGDARPYALVSQGNIILFLVPQPGLDLDRYVERQVQFWGPVSYHNELRNYFMTVQQVRVLTP